MNLNFTEAGGVAFLLIAFGLVPVAWKVGISLTKFFFLALGVFYLSLFLLVIGFCEAECGFATAPYSRLLYWALGYWGTIAVHIVGAVFFLWVAVKVRD